MVDRLPLLSVAKGGLRGSLHGVEITLQGSISYGIIFVLAQARGLEPADILRVHSASSNMDSAAKVLKRDSSTWESSGSGGPDFRHWIMFEILQGKRRR